MPALRKQESRRPKGVTRAAVAEAAAAVCEQDGIDALSMRRVASRLGVTPMALYNHVGNKAELLDLVTRHALGQVVLDETLGPRPQLLSLLDQLRALGARYPRLVEAGTLLDGSDSAVRLTVAVLRLLGELGLGPAQVRLAHNALAMLVTGAAAVQRTGEREGATARARHHEAAVLRDASADEMLAAMRGLPAVTIDDQFVAAVELVLDALGAE